MTTPALSVILHTDRYFALETSTGDLVLADQASPSPPRTLFTGRDAVPFLRTLCALPDRELLFNWRRTFLANRHGAWEQLRTVSELDCALHDMAHFCHLPPSADPAALSWGNSDPDAPLRALLHSAGLLVYENVQRTLCERLLASAVTFPEVAGFLEHPVVGVPVERWLYPKGE